MGQTKRAGALMAVTLLALAGCTEETVTASPAPLRTAPASDERICLAAVAAKTNANGVVLESLTSEANNTVIIGVGPSNARWQCLINRGVVAEVMSLTNEGTL